MLLLRAVERELRVYRRVWYGSAFTTFAQPLLFLSAMGLGLGGLIDDRSTDLGGMEYIDFIAPGLLAASVMLNTAGESLWPVMGGVKWMGTYHGMVATQMSPRDVYGGFVVWAGLRAVITTFPFLIVAALLGGIDSLWAPFAVVPVVALALAIAAGLGAYSIRCETDSTFSLIMRLGAMPLFLFSGTFFPVDQFPGPLQVIAYFSPLWHAVEACRSFTTGDLSITVLGHTAVLFAIVAAVWSWGVRGFEEALTP